MKRLIVLALPLLAACSSIQNMSLPKVSMPDVSGWMSPYRMDVRQGNLVTQEMVSQLKAGMTKDQVRYALGTPLLTDVFHADRWDYVYRLAEGKGKVEERRFTVFFEEGKLVRVAGDVVPAQTKASDQPVAAATSRVVEFKLPDGKQLPAPETAKPQAQPEGKPWYRSLWPF